MKKLYLTILTILVSAITLAQRPETILQPLQIITYTDHSGFSPRLSLFEYNDNGALTKFTMFEEYEEWYDLSNTDTVIFQYDNRNTIVNCSWLSYRPMSYDLDWEWYGYLYRYNEYNRLEELDTYNNVTSQVIERWIPVYDEHDRVISDTFFNKAYSDYYGSLKLKQTRDYIYSDSEKVTVREQYNTDGSPKHKYRITQVITPEGAIQNVKWEKYDYNNNVFVNKKLINYIYSNNRLAAVETNVWNETGKWLHNQKITYTRNSNGHIILSEYQLWNGEFYTNNKRTLYDLNDDGYPLMICFQDYSYDENNWIPGFGQSNNEYYGGEYVNYYIPNYYNDILVDSVFTQQHLRFINNHLTSSDAMKISKIEINYVETPNPHYAVNENEDIKAKIYPNPTNGIVNISGENIVNVEVVNIMGQVVLSKICDADETKIDISSLNTGVYLIKLKTKDGKEFAERIVKE